MERLTIPEEAEVKAALQELQLRQPGMGIAKMVESIKTGHPSWALSVDRARKLRKSLKPESEPSPKQDTAPEARVVLGSRPPVHHRPPPPPLREVENGLNRLTGLDFPTALAILNGHMDFDTPTPQENNNLPPMDVLIRVIDRLCAGGDVNASRRSAQIDMTLSTSDELSYHRPCLPAPSCFVEDDWQDMANIYSTRSCNFAVNLVLLFAAPDSALPTSIPFKTQLLGRISTFMTVNGPSAKLQVEYHRAQSWAVMSGLTTVLGVDLVDVGLLVRGQGRKLGGADKESFVHSFAMIVAPNGVRILQACGELGCWLGENLASNAGRTRTFEEAKQFAQDFEELTLMAGPWHQGINDLYKKLFGVDIAPVKDGAGFKPWAKSKGFLGVKSVDIIRWDRILEEIDARYNI